MAEGVASRKSRLTLRPPPPAPRPKQDKRSRSVFSQEKRVMDLNFKKTIM